MSDDNRRPRSVDTRAKIVESAVSLLAERGTTATGLNQIVEASGVSYGSVYHQFRDGKDALIAEAVTAAGEQIAEALDAVFATAPSLSDACTTMFDYGAGLLTSSGFARGCPIGTAIGDGHRVDAVRAASTRTFDRWNEIIRREAIRFGASEDDARRFASVVVSLYEGALLVARSARSTAPLDDAAESAVHLAQLVAP